MSRGSRVTVEHFSLTQRILHVVFFALILLLIFSVVLLLGFLWSQSLVCRYTCDIYFNPVSTIPNGQHEENLRKIVACANLWCDIFYALPWLANQVKISWYEPIRNGIRRPVVLRVVTLNLWGEDFLTLFLIDWIITYAHLNNQSQGSFNSQHILECF